MTPATEASTGVDEANILNGKTPKTVVIVATVLENTPWSGVPCPVPDVFVTGRACQGKGSRLRANYFGVRVSFRRALDLHYGCAMHVMRNL